MALTTVEHVRQTGGIAAANDYLLFQLDDDAALNAEVSRMLTRASAWLATRAPDFYTGSVTSDTAVDSLFEGAEEALAMHYLTMQLKARKVYGTHFPYDQEGSERFEELIDVEWVAQMEGLVGAYLNALDTIQHPFALPVMGTTSTVTNDDREPVTTTIGTILDRAENRVPSRSVWNWP